MTTTTVVGNFFTVSILLILLATDDVTLVLGREDHSVSDSLKGAMASLFGKNAGAAISSSESNKNNKSRTTMKVINVGLPRTGTSSFVTAMNRLGFKSYHMKDGVQDAPGHVEMWCAHAALAYNNDDDDDEKKKRNGDGDSDGDDFVIKREWKIDPKMIASQERIFDRLEEDGFNSTSDMPMILYYRELVERYYHPDNGAVFVLTEHHSGDPKRWASSVLETIGLNQKIFMPRPWSWIPWLPPFLRFEKWMWHGVGIARDPATLEFDRSDLEKLYVDWNEEVEEYFRDKNIPLLKFKATDGWKPLCDFLSSSSSPVLKSSSVDVKSECTRIVASGEQFPKANTDLRQFLNTMYLVTRFFRMPLAFLFLLFAGVAMLFAKACCFCCCRRTGRTSNEKRKLHDE